MITANRRKPIGTSSLRFAYPESSVLLGPTSRPRPGSPSGQTETVEQDCADRAGMPAHLVASDYREAALPQAQAAALGPVKFQVIAKASLFGLQSPWLLVSPAALPRQVRERRTS